MNAEKLKRLQAQVRIGGKGTPRRKKKVTHQTAATDDKKLQSSLKKLSVSSIPGIEEVNIIKDDLSVIHFNNPKAQASLSANTFAITGHGEMNKVVEMLPEILPQLGQETVAQLRMFANSMTNGKSQMQKQGTTVSDDLADDVPSLVEDFDQIAKQEASPEFKANSGAKPKNKLNDTSEDIKKHEKDTTSNQREQQPPTDAQQSNIKAKTPSIIEADDSKKTDLKHPDTKGESIKENQEKQIKENKLEDDSQKGTNESQNKAIKDDKTGNKNNQTQEAKKDLSTVASEKDASKEHIQKESQLSNKQSQDSNINKKTQDDKDQQQPDDQHTQKQSVALNQAPNPDIGPKEKMIENISSAELLNKSPDILGSNTSSQIDKKITEEQNISHELFLNKQASEAGVTKDADPISFDVMATTKQLQLSTPTVTPTQTETTTPEVDAKLSTIPLECKNVADMSTTEASRPENVADITGENLTNLKENVQQLPPTAPQQSGSVGPTESQKIAVEGNQEPEIGRAILKETASKQETNKEIQSTETLVEKQGNALKVEGKVSSPSQRKGADKSKQQSNQKQKAPTETVNAQQSNQKQVAPKETAKQSATKERKQTQESKKLSTAKENKKEGEAPKTTPASSKSQSQNKNLTAKPTSSSKPTTAAKSAPTPSPASSSSKPRTNSNPNATNTKPSNPTAESKQNVTPTANKPKAQAPQGPPKQGKQRPASGSTGENPIAAAKSASPSQATDNK